MKLKWNIIICLKLVTVRDSVVGWGTALQAWDVAVSIPNGVIEIFYWLNPSGRTVALRSTPALTEMNIRYMSWG